MTNNEVSDEVLRVSVSDLRSDLRGHIDDWSRWLQQGRFSARTVEMFVEVLELLGRFTRWKKSPTEVSLRDLEAFFQLVLDERMPVTSACRYRGVRLFFDWLVKEGKIDKSPLEGVIYLDLDSTGSAV